MPFLLENAGIFSILGFLLMADGLIALSRKSWFEKRQAKLPWLRFLFPWVMILELILGGLILVALVWSSFTG